MPIRRLNELVHVKGHRRHSVIICWMDGCEFLHSALGITGLGKTLPFTTKFHNQVLSAFITSGLVGRPSSTMETIIAREVLQVQDVKWSILGHRTDVKGLEGNQTLFTCQVGALTLVGQGESKE